MGDFRGRKIKTLSISFKLKTYLSIFRLCDYLCFSSKMFFFVWSFFLANTIVPYVYVCMDCESHNKDFALFSPEKTVMSE